MNLPELSKTAGDRFSIVSAFPSALVILAVFALAKTDAFPKRPSLSVLATSPHPISAGDVLLLTLSVFVLALVLQPFQLGLVRLLEGYWGASAMGVWLQR